MWRHDMLTYEENLIFIPELLVVWPAILIKGIIFLNSNSSFESKQIQISWANDPLTEGATVLTRCFISIYLHPKTKKINIFKIFVILNDMNGVNENFTDHCIIGQVD